jgi:hypothetical protein
MTEAQDKLRRALAPYTYDGTEAMAAIITLINEFSQHSSSQALIAAIRKILVHQYGGSAPLDAVINYYDRSDR